MNNSNGVRSYTKQFEPIGNMLNEDYEVAKISLE